MTFMDVHNEIDYGVLDNHREEGGREGRKGRKGRRGREGREGRVSSQDTRPGCPFELIILKDTRPVCPWEFNRASISGSNVHMSGILAYGQLQIIAEAD